MTCKSLGIALGLVACLGLSACNSSGGVGDMSQGETAGTGLGAELTSELLSSPPQLIRNVLAAARAVHGSVPDYLMAHGLSEANLAALRSALGG